MDTAVQGVAAGDSLPSAADSEPGNAQGGSFGNLMNSLLAAPRLQQGAAATGDRSMTPLPAATAGDEPVFQSAPDGSPFDILVPDPPASAAMPLPLSPDASLPPAGKALPPVFAETAEGEIAVNEIEAAMAAETHDDGDGDPLQCTAAPQIVPWDTVPGSAADAEPRAAMDGAALADTGASPAATGQIQAPAPLPAPATTMSAVPLPSSPAGSLTTVAAPSAPPAQITPEAGAARDAAAPRTDAAMRSEQIAVASADTQPEAGSDHDSTPDGGTRLQELLARIGAGDGAARTRSESFTSLLQAADSGSQGGPAALTYAQAGMSGGPVRDAAPGLAVHTPLRHPEWSDEVSQRIRWAIGNQVQSAEMKLNPPQLGPLEVRVSVDSDRQMTVTLSSQHALVRETLQENLPRLRDLMSEQGFGAVNVDISQHSSSDGRKPAPQQADTDAAPRAEAAPTGAADAGPGRLRETRSLVDLYA
ncbi:MAG: flagellar hook-length control protein FliK [Gammaproteobacteria bacterium]|nr:flagellar hook-length control protein FliK [Gammaproteobacteria bacterium]